MDGRFCLRWILGAMAIAVSALPAQAQRAAILIDGRFDDWASVPSHVDPAHDTHDTAHHAQDDAPAPVENADADLLEYKAAHDDHALYFFFRSRGRIAQTQKASGNKPASRFYLIVAIDVDDDDETGYWLHEGGYYPTSRGYDINAEIEYYNGEFNTAGYLNHGARDEAELRQAFQDQSSQKYVEGRDGPYPAGFLRLVPGTYKQYTQWVYGPDGALTFVRDKGPVVPGVAKAALHPDGDCLEACFPFVGFLKDARGRPVIAPGKRIDMSFSLEGSGEHLRAGRWASDTAEPIQGYVLK